MIPEASENDWKLGSSVHRIDVEEKVLGYGKYPDDWYLPDMCYGSAVRSQYPRARVLAIDASKAEALPGVVRVITAADIPGENKGRPSEARPVFAHPHRRADALSGRRDRTRGRGNA